MSSISDALDKDYAPAWRPEPGDKLVGVVVDLSEREGLDGIYPIVTVRTDDGTDVAFHAFHTVAANELAKLRPKIGDQIGIKYVGRIQGANSRSSYHGYRVRTIGTTQGVNWSRYGDSEEPDAAPNVPVVATDTPAPAVSSQFGDDVPF